MSTQIKKKQLKTEEFIQPKATADWTRDDITASAKAIAEKIRNAGTKKITANYKIWELDEGIYLVDGTKQANYRGGTFTLYQNYYLFVMNQSNSVPETKKWIAVYETDNNGEDVHFIYGTCSSSSGYKAEKSLSEIRNMGGATANAAGSAGFAPAPAAGDNTKYLRGDATWQAIPNMTGATSSVAGNAGLVPAPAAGYEGKVLFGDGTWKNVGIILDGVAVGYTTAGYKYQFEYGGNRISYSEIVAKILNCIPVVATTNGPLWYLDRELINNSYEYVFKQVIVKNNQLQLRRLRHVVENNEDFWNEEIEFTTT